MAKLRERNVKAIRRSPYRDSILAEKYGVTAGCIKFVREYITWGHVP